VTAAQADRGAVLITGTSTGIGAACARALDRRGFRVFAGVRREADGERLRQNAGERLTPVIIDVTDAASIEAARASIAQAVGAAGLAGLVNNAGISVAGPIEFIPLDDLRRQFEVNVTGQVAVTQAFMPLIRAGKGRVVFMSSVAGHLAAPMLGPYAASKHAIEAIADAMRVELASSGIRVALVEPGAIRSEIWDKGLRDAEARIEQLPPDGHAYYDEAIDKVIAYARKQADGAIAAGHVARAVHHALTASRPRARYVVGRDARISIALQRWAPASVRDRLVRTQLGI
jgi:NAD(P)-dependent dehydrogenase (short-subunit alcohol dehydrogenase family)